MYPLGEGVTLPTHKSLNLMSETLRHIEPIIPHSTELVFFLYALSMAFTKDIRHEVRRRQRGICDSCGERTGGLQAHHRIPESRGGSSVDIEKHLLDSSIHRHIR